jgi:predicted MarR family transcription regulator
MDRPIPDTPKRAGAFCWAALVARVLHPVDVAIIEAFEWIEQPLSAGDLSEVFDSKWPLAKVTYHIRRLHKLDAIELSATPTMKNIADVRYRLLERPRDGC